MLLALSLLIFTCKTNSTQTYKRDSIEMTAMLTYRYVLRGNPADHGGGLWNGPEHSRREPHLEKHLIRGGRGFHGVGRQEKLQAVEYSCCRH